MTDMTAEWIARRREIEQAATEGPWEWEEPSTDSWPQADQSLIAPSVVQDSEGSSGDVLYAWGYDASGINASDEDRAFIADARTSLPRALDALEAVLALWPDADPCPPRTCVHVDCEVINTITEALTGGESDG